MSDPLPAPEAALRESLDTLHSYLQDAETYLEEKNHERVRQNLADLARIATAAIQQSYVVETLDPDYESLLVDAVRAAVKYRNAWRHGKPFTTVTRHDVNEVLRGRIDADGKTIWSPGRSAVAPDARIAGTQDRVLDDLVSRGILYRTPSGIFLGVTADQPTKGKRNA